MELDYERRLSPVDRRVISRRHQSLQVLGLGNKKIRDDIKDFSIRLGATDEEVRFDVLPSLGFNEKLRSPFGFSVASLVRSLFKR